MELLYVVAALIALALLWRGVTWVQDYRRRLRIRLEPVPPGPEVAETFPELGKVRVRPRLGGEDAAETGDEPALGPVIIVGSRDRDDARMPRVAPVPASAHRTAAAPAVAVGEPRDERAPSGMAAGADAPPPVAAAAGADSPADAEPVPALAAPDESDAQAAASPAPAGEAEAGASGAAQPPVLVSPVATPLQEAEQQDMFADEMIAPPPMPGRPRNRAQVLYGTPEVEPVRPVRPLAEEKPYVEVQDVIALHVVARQHPFNGEDLLRCILGYGLRFGDMSIFHRHERPTGQGKILFSMAKAVEPGIFDLQAMSGEEIPGVSFFLSLPGVNSIHAYDIMVDTAKRLATELQGEILDEQRQPLTRQLVEHYRERVQEFERRRLMQRPAH